MAADLRHIRTAVNDGVATLVIDRAARFNSLDAEAARQLHDAARRLSRDDDVRCVVVRSVGGIFCSGADLEPLREHGDALRHILEHLHLTISEVRQSEKPWIAAVNGVAAAGGFGLAMACDLVYAIEDATFEWAYYRSALTGAESSTFFLPRLVGLRTAMEIVLLNPRLSARAAQELRLINGVFPAETFDSEVDAIALRIADGPTRSFSVAKRLLNLAAGVDQLDHHLGEELRHAARGADRSHRPELVAGIEAFFGRRVPDFAGSGAGEGDG